MLKQNKKMFIILGSLTVLVLVYTYTRNLRVEKKQENVKYILEWTSASTEPFVYLEKGFSSFNKNNCSFKNCYVTNRNMLRTIEEFDAILFHGPEVRNYRQRNLPRSRDPKQKYVFASMESSHNYPICNNLLENFFNWTWTYRLDSDFRWGYITIYDLNGNVIGPAENMNWPDLEPITDEVKNKLSTKSKAAAWFVSNCNPMSGRNRHAKQVESELKMYGWTVDTFGSCGKYKCPRSDSNKCFEMLEKDYYFYFAFENSFAKDYVTEKILNALNHYAVPVVFGSANYSRFLPPGSYLDALELQPKKLASVMDEVIKNKTKYYDFFRWRNHFVYKETSQNEDICKLCDALNDENKVKTFSVYANFSKWWNSEFASC